MRVQEALNAGTEGDVTVLRRHSRRFHEIARPLERVQQRLNARPEGGVTATLALRKGASLRGGEFEVGGEKLFFAIHRGGSDSAGFALARSNSASFCFHSAACSGLPQRS